MKLGELTWPDVEDVPRDTVVIVGETLWHLLNNTVYKLSAPRKPPHFCVGMNCRNIFLLIFKQN